MNALLNSAEVVTAYNDMCKATNQFLATLNGTPVISNGRLEDFGAQISLLKNVIPKPTTTTVGGINFITGISLDKTFSNVGAGTKRVGDFNVSPFNGLTQSVCTPVS
ncbi:MAG: hypothetical protein O2821_04880 [Chloroflexi bacterium]|nr:hypothetical protein [Chloroflexota bacterium]MDA1227917.1 hypothetical protein [Chloroflexota bacterium]